VDRAGRRTHRHTGRGVQAGAAGHHTKPPGAEVFREALEAFTRDADALRTDAIVRELPAQAFGQVFALGFAFEQFQKNLGDLLARTDKLAAERTKSTSGS